MTEKDKEHESVNNRSLGKQVNFSCYIDDLLNDINSLCNHFSRKNECNEPECLVKNIMED